LFFEPDAVTKDGKIIAPTGTNSILSEAKKRKVFSYCVFNKGQLGEAQKNQTRRKQRTMQFCKR
jgi:hypothetical protein